MSWKMMRLDEAAYDKLIEKRKKITKKTYPTACIYIPEGWYTVLEVDTILADFKLAQKKRKKLLDHSMEEVDAKKDSGTIPKS